MPARIPRAAGSLRRDRSAGFTGFGRAATDADGRYGFTTVTPGSAVRGGAPFFAITVFARGLLNRLFTRAYLPDGDLDADPLLACVDPERRATLLCVAENASGRPGYRFDIHLQGPHETVFLAYRDAAMTNLLWPGDHRAGEHMTDRTLLRSMVAVESAWLRALAAAGLAPADCAGVDL